MHEVVELVGRAIAEADGEDYMEDWRRYDRRARYALSAMPELARGFLPSGLTQAQRDTWESKVADLINDWQIADDCGVEPLSVEIVDAIFGPSEVVKTYAKLSDLTRKLSSDE